MSDQQPPKNEGADALIGFLSFIAASETPDGQSSSQTGMSSEASPTTTSGAEQAQRQEGRAGESTADNDASSALPPIDAFSHAPEEGQASVGDEEEEMVYVEDSNQGVFQEATNQPPPSDQIENDTTEGADSKFSFARRGSRDVSMEQWNAQKPRPVSVGGGSKRASGSSVVTATVTAATTTTTVTKGKRGGQHQTDDDNSSLYSGVGLLDDLVSDQQQQQNEEEDGLDGDLASRPSTRRGGAGKRRREGSWEDAGAVVGQDDSEFDIEEADEDTEAYGGGGGGVGSAGVIGGGSGGAFSSGRRTRKPVTRSETKGKPTRERNRRGQYKGLHERKARTVEDQDFVPEDADEPFEAADQSYDARPIAPSSNPPAARSGSASGGGGSGGFAVGHSRPKRARGGSSSVLSPPPAVSDRRSGGSQFTTPREPRTSARKSLLSQNPVRGTKFSAVSRDSLSRLFVERLHCPTEVPLAIRTLDSNFLSNHKPTLGLEHHNIIAPPIKLPGNDTEAPSQPHTAEPHHNPLSRNLPLPPSMLRPLSRFNASQSSFMAATAAAAALTAKAQQHLLANTASVMAGRLPAPTARTTIGRLHQPTPDLPVPGGSRIPPIPQISPNAPLIPQSQPTTAHQPKQAMPAWPQQPSAPFPPAMAPQQPGPSGGQQSRLMALQQQHQAITMGTPSRLLQQPNRSSTNQGVYNCLNKFGLVSFPRSCSHIAAAYYAMVSHADQNDRPVPTQYLPVWLNPQHPRNRARASQAVQAAAPQALSGGMPRTLTNTSQIAQSVKSHQMASGASRPADGPSNSNNGQWMGSGMPFLPHHGAMNAGAGGGSQLSSQQQQQLHQLQMQMQMQQMRPMLAQPNQNAPTSAQSASQAAMPQPAGSSSQPPQPQPPSSSDQTMPTGDLSKDTGSASAKDPAVVSPAESPQTAQQQQQQQQTLSRALTPPVSTPTSTAPPNLPSTPQQHMHPPQMPRPPFPSPGPGTPQQTQPQGYFMHPGMMMGFQQRPQGPPPQQYPGQTPQQQQPMFASAHQQQMAAQLSQQQQQQQQQQANFARSMPFPGQPPAGFGQQSTPQQQMQQMSGKAFPGPMMQQMAMQMQGGPGPSSASSRLPAVSSILPPSPSDPRNMKPQGPPQMGPMMMNMGMMMPGGSSGAYMHPGAPQGFDQNAMMASMMRMQQQQQQQQQQSRPPQPPAQMMVPGGPGFMGFPPGVPSGGPPQPPTQQGPPPLGLS